MRAPWIALAAALAMVAGGCTPGDAGGGGGGTGTGDDDVGIVSLDADCADADRAPTERGDDRFRAAVLCLVNAERDVRGLATLEPRDPLTEAAQVHADDMAARGYFAHNAPDGADVADRARGAGYSRRGVGRWQVGENLGYVSGGRTTPRRLMRGWMESPGHRRNLLQPAHRDAGIGVTRGSPGQGRPPGVIAVQVFGRR
ncbi:MAG TPA: CAP domain-containing protein [Miltoncostaeaceae bacterium]|nr:CAP domain-containing protein [Miltoncostaeaceae bacterium]